LDDEPASAAAADDDDAALNEAAWTGVRLTPPPV
jgi:hypothetical protein